MLRIGIVGDVHLLFDQEDVRLLDAQGYALLLFVGDLASYSHRGGLRVARTIGRLRTPALVMPGNHDAANVGQMAAEVLAADAIIPLVGAGQARRTHELEVALSPARAVGFSVHRVASDGLSIDIVAGRPHSAGGQHFAFRPWLRERYGVDGFEASAEKLRARVDASDAAALVFFAHTGPTGLGESRSDIWGCDFRRDEGDFGDRDLREALDHARARGKRILAVVAGHMHHALKGGGQRRWQLEDDGTLYVNAACVPRIFEKGKRRVHHHVELVIDGGRAIAQERLLST
ncbi:MAG: metallophosphoesterase [Sandaracinaceae bacterium]|nr:metallophosphoesterase [Sandaracinaceae bacterium]